MVRSPRFSDRGASTPDEATLAVCRYDRGLMEYSRERLYARHPFSAPAEVLDAAGAMMRTRVTEISYGGCRLIAQGRFPVGAAVALTISTPKDHFETTAKVVHSTVNDVGLMFVNSPRRLCWCCESGFAQRRRRRPKLYESSQLYAQDAGRNKL